MQKCSAQWPLAGADVLQTQRAASPRLTLRPMVHCCTQSSAKWHSAVGSEVLISVSLIEAAPAIGSMIAIDAPQDSVLVADAAPALRIILRSHSFLGGRRAAMQRAMRWCCWQLAAWECIRRSGRKERTLSSFYLFCRLSGCGTISCGSPRQNLFEIS